MSANASPGAVCTTPACVHVASEMLWALAPNHTAIDPCTDFDKFACAGWQDRTEVPSGQKTIDTLGQTQNNVLWAIKQILEGPYPTGGDVGWVTKSLTEEQIAVDKKNFETAQRAYNTCMNLTAIEKAGIDPLVEFVKDIAQTFPVDAKSNKTDSEALVNTILKLERAGIDTFFKPYVIQDPDDPDKNIIYVNGATFSELSGAANATQSEFNNLTAKLLQAVHPANLTLENALRKTTDVTKFVSKLALIELAGSFGDPSLLDTTASVPRVSLQELDKAAPALGLSRVVESLAPKDYKPDQVLVPTVDFLKNASELVTAAPPQLLQDFFVWRAAFTLASYVDSEETTPLNNLLDDGGDDGKSGEPALWAKCVEELDSGAKWGRMTGAAANTLTYTLTRFFVDKHYSQEARNYTAQMAETLRDEFGSRVLAKDWIANVTKAAAKEKVDKMVRNIGFPNQITDPQYLHDFYDGLEITDSFFDNALAMATFAAQKTFAQLGRPYDRSSFGMSPLTTNAYYDPVANSITILVGIQQYPAFDYEFPSYISYGGMGSIVGHEITHGFDDSGRNYDATGRKRQWWDNSTIKAFEDRTDCFVEQFDNMTVRLPNGTEKAVKGKLTLGENIADSGGVATSFGAWKRMQKMHKRDRDMKLPGLEGFSDEQLFFLKWAQDWCAVKTPEQVVKQISSDVHAPGFARIKGPLANSREFLQAFNCPKKEPTCELW